MLEKKKNRKTKILCMLFLVTAILAGSATAYARTVIDKDKSFYKTWSYTFVGTYNSSDGKVSGSTKASFVPYRDSYTEVKVYEISKKDPYKYRKVYDNYISCSCNAGKNNNNVRVQHHAYYRKEGSAVGGHTIY